MLFCRFTGHSRRFYSVAQHSHLASRLVAVPADEWDANEVRLWALLHDASEAYLCDIATPVKRQPHGYAEAEEILMGAIARRFGLSWPMPKTVKEVDARLCAPAMRTRSAMTRYRAGFPTRGNSFRRAEEKRLRPGFVSSGHAHSNFDAAPASYRGYCQSDLHGGEPGYDHIQLALLGQRQHLSDRESRRRLSHNEKRPPQRTNPLRSFCGLLCRSGEKQVTGITPTWEPNSVP
jgi:hypothetical protein